MPNDHRASVLEGHPCCQKGCFLSINNPELIRLCHIARIWQLGRTTQLLIDANQLHCGLCKEANLFCFTLHAVGMLLVQICQNDLQLLLAQTAAVRELSVRNLELRVIAIHEAYGFQDSQTKQSCKFDLCIVFGLWVRTAKIAVSHDCQWKKPKPSGCTRGVYAAWTVATRALQARWLDPPDGTGVPTRLFWRQYCYRSAHVTT